MGAVAGPGTEIPVPVAVGRRGAQQRCTIIDIHGAAGRGRAGQSQYGGIGNAVAYRAAVGRE